MNEINGELRDHLITEVLEHFIGNLPRTRSGSGYYLPMHTRSSFVENIAIAFHKMHTLLVHDLWFMGQTQWSKTIFTFILERRIDQWSGAGLAGVRLRNKEDKKQFMALIVKDVQRMENFLSSY